MFKKEVEFLVLLEVIEKASASESLIFFKNQTKKKSSTFSDQIYKFK